MSSTRMSSVSTSQSSTIPTSQDVDFVFIRENFE